MSQHRSTRPIAAVAVAAVLGLGVAACGVSASTDRAASTDGGTASGIASASFIRSAAARTGEVTSEKVVMTSEISGLPGGTVTTTAQGAFDTAAKRGHLTVDLSGGGGDDEAGLGAMEIVVDDGAAYVSGSVFEMFLPEGKTWLRVDASEMSDAAPKGFGMEPGRFLEFLEGAGDQVETVGTEEVRGVSTTHVRTTLQLDKLLERVPAAKRERLQASIDQLGAKADVIRAMPVDAWIDGDDLVRKIVLQTKPVSIGDDAVSEKLTLELYDFDQPVTIDVPDADETSDLGDAFTEGFGSVLDGETGGALGGD